jgi:SAM-dependent methyltransferase
MPDAPDLDSAYALQTPEDNRALYARWARTYDTDFAAGMDYRLPQIVALTLVDLAPEGPILDVGAGTGLVAQALAPHLPLEIDALDISAQMLDVAMGKGLYAGAIEADLTGPLDIADGIYGAVVSSGTFTHGHVGPDALDALLRIARPGAQFVLAVNAAHYEARGFAAKFAALASGIAHLQMRETAIYGPDTDAPHARDTAQIVTFQKR